MPKYVVDKCCGFVDLKSGCYIIGYLNLIGNLALTVYTTLALTGALLVLRHPDLPKEHRAIFIAAAVIIGIILIFILLNLTFAIVLLVGLHKNKPGHLKAYMIYTLIFLVISILRFIIDGASLGLYVGAAIQYIIIILLSIYFLVVIRSQYFVMKSPPRGPAIYTA